MCIIRFRRGAPHDVELTPMVVGAWSGTLPHVYPTHEAHGGARHVMIRPGAIRLAAAAALALATLFPAAPSHGAAPATALPSPSALAAVISRAQMPDRDFTAIYARLVHHGAIAPLALPATDYPIGQERGFYIGD